MSKITDSRPGGTTIRTILRHLLTGLLFDRHQRA